MPKKLLSRKIKKIVDDEDIDTIMEEETHAKVFGSIDKEVILQKVFILKIQLNSINFQEREHITSILASMEMSENDDAIKNKILNSDLARSLVEKLNDPFLQVRYNSLMAIMNILICFGNTEADIMYIKNCSIICHIERYLKEYISNLNMKMVYSEGEKEKYNKIFIMTYDLLLLMIEHFSDNREFFSNINGIFECSIFIITDAVHFSEDLIIKSCLFLANLASIKILPYYENQKNFYELCAKVVFENKDSNFLIKASFTCFIFYSACYNENLRKVFQLSKIIELIYTSLYSGQLGSDIKLLTHDIDNLLRGINNDDESNNKENNENENNPVKEIIEDSKKTVKLDESTLDKIKQSFKNRIKQIEEKVYLKTMIDITNGIDSLKSNQNDLKVDDDDDDILEDTVDDCTNEGVKIDNLISKNVTSLINGENISKIFNKTLLSNLISNCNIDLDEYIFNDYDKLIVVKELLYDFEYYSVSMINNIILNFDILKSFNDISIEKELYYFSFKKLASPNLIYHNPDYLSLILTLVRNILENNKNIIEIVKEDFNYKALLLVMNKNINDPMIKINIIDILSFIFSKVNHSSLVNEEICAILFNFCLNETDIEVLAHVMNSFMDIWSEDNYNFVLKKLEIVEKMKSGLSEFKNKVKLAYKSRIIDIETRKYCNLAVTNLKGFIQYKEKMYQSQNLI